MDTLKLLKERHSVRKYLDKPIEEEKRQVLNNLIEEINNKTGLHIQAIFDEPKCFGSAVTNYGKFKNVDSYICLVGKKSKNLDEELGYYGEEIVIKAQELGLNTCFVALTHGKTKSVVNKGEKEVCIISVGYGENQGISHKSKSITDVSNYTDDKPSWFKECVEYALLAPTALNQQKFFIEYKSDDDIIFSSSLGFYAKMDLGIVKFNFETAKKLLKKN